MTVKVIRTNGAEEQYEIPRRDALESIYRLIGCTTCDSVTLPDGLVMLVDDDGWECEFLDHGNGHFDCKPTRPRKPINPKATAIYHGVCRAGTTHQIVGDVAIVTDADFA